MRILCAAAIAAISVVSSADAATLVTNGSFEQTSNGLGQINSVTQATGWSVPNGGYTFIMDGTADTAGANGQYGNLKLWGPGDGSNNGFTVSPDGGNFLASDGAFIQQPIQQTINGLVAGKTYNVSFYFGGIQQQGYTGAQTEQFKVSLGDETHSTAVLTNASHGFTGWQHETFKYTATGPSEVLSFLAVGTPAGVPPFSVLDGVTLGTPEPATWAMLVVGFGGIGAVMRRRRTTNTTFA